MEFITDFVLEDYILNTKWKDLPEQVKERVVVCSIDLMTALILGSCSKQFEIGLRLAKSNYQRGDVSPVGAKAHLNFLGAAVAMGHAANSFDIDDGYNFIKGHPGASFVAGVLAAAQAMKITYREYLTTIAICYEVAIRWAIAMQDHYSYLHSSGAYGAFATAAGVGRLFGLDRKGLNNALSIADYHAPMTPVMRAVEYPSMNKDGIPFGTLIGANAVLETIVGTTGKTHLLELQEYRYLLDTLRYEHEIMNLYFKRYTCCRWAHPAIAACLTLMQRNQVCYSDIDCIKVYTFGAATRLSRIIPADTDEAQYNIAYPIAAAIVHGDVGLLQVSDKYLNDSRVISLMSRLEFIVDPYMEAQFPEKRYARIEILLKNKKSLCSDMFSAPGEAEDNVDLNWISDKFLKLTKPLLSTKAQNEILEMLYSPNEKAMHEIVEEVNKLIK